MIRSRAQHSPASPRRLFGARWGLTLVELLVVVAIVGLLAQIAVVNLAEATMRANIAAARSNIRVLTQSLEAYAIDAGGYPPSISFIPNDPFGVLSDWQLARLTSPVAYTSAASFKDPFGVVEEQSFVDGNGGGDFPVLGQPNINQALLFYAYPQIALRFGEPEFDRRGTGSVSIGPDARDTLGAYRPFSEAAFLGAFGFTGLGGPLDTEFDPTNGTHSAGDIFGFTGEAQRYEIR